jgi:S-DNA-T family DNA segregation ATPase FtsK/SpoIIIE
MASRHTKTVACGWNGDDRYDVLKAMEFRRPSRLPAPPTPAGEIVVKAPPELQRAAPPNPLARLLPIAMVVAVVGMLLLYLSSGSASRSPMFMFFPAMMLVSVLGTVAYGARGTQRIAEINADRRDYLRYLDGLSETCDGTAHQQHASLHWRHPIPDGLWALAGGPRMWERGPDDQDFGVTRIGVGSRPLSTALLEPDVEGLAESDPVTVGAVHQLIRNRSHVPDVPITLSLSGIPVLVVEGTDARGLLRAMVCQLATLHGPDCLRIATVVSADTASHWEWMKWLPHHQHPSRVDAVGPVRLRYRDVDAAQRDLTTWAVGRTVVIVDGFADVEHRDVGGPGAVSVVAVGGDAVDGVRVDTDSVPVIVDGGVLSCVDSLTQAQAVVCARRLAPFQPAPGSDSASAGHDWAALIGVDTPADATPKKLWPRRGVGSQLRVPIGTNANGTMVELDIKEAAHGGMGPHGLCIGATGSGKSEFLRTLTLGMLATHPPDELNLVLVDFKGGATFLGFERAPHVSAVITNLADEAHLVARMRAALAGEMNRRQEALRAAGNFADLAGYNAARRRGAQLDPLPALLIVVDEFSELLQQHPDFAELFGTIGRLGRSLGMHLLLASQRLDEGRLRGLDSHLSYRICLKTFSAPESRAVLGVPDAYHLPGEPGAAYLKTVASGEMARFRTAYVSGDAGPAATSTAQATPVPQMFTAAFVPVAQPVPSASDAPIKTVLDTVLDNLVGHGTPAHQVWLAPLTASPALDTLLASPARSRGRLSAPVGLVDRPFDQRRDLLTVDLAGAAGNTAIVGGPRSGKSTAVRALLLSLAATHDSRDVQFYCLDFGGGALSSLRRLPHVGSVAGRHDADLVRRTIAEAEALLRAREQRFRRRGIDSIADYRALRASRDISDDPHGDVFVVIDGWATVRQDFEGLEGPITALAAQGLSFGIHVVIAASRWAEIRPALKDQIGTRIELRLGDSAESEMDRKRARELGDCPPGRGICRSGDEFVIALPRLDGTPTDVGLAEALGSAVDTVRTGSSGPDAPPVRLLPSRVDLERLAAAPADRAVHRIVIGIGERELQPVTVEFGEQPNLVILGDGECGKTSALRALCCEIVRTTGADGAQLLIVDYRRTLLGVVESEHLVGYAISATAVTTQMSALAHRLDSRMPGDAVTQHQLRTRTWWSGPEIYVVVDDYDLVAGATGNPLTPLLDYLPHAKDLGLHVVVARRSGGAARAMFDPVLARLRDLGASGLMMSASPDDGVLLGTVRPRPLPPGRGTLITRSRPDEIIQVAWVDPPG